MDRNVDIAGAVPGSRMAIINDILFKGRQHIDWNEVEAYLKQYVGTVVRMEESEDAIYIGRDLPDEYTGSNYTARLKGTLAKAKANAAQGIPEMIAIAGNKRFQENLAKKHTGNARFGWFRYDSKFALPIFDEKGAILRYNVFRAELVVRYAADKQLYLYDIINIKKETGTPLEH